jgi:hypothetical protein
MHPESTLSRPHHVDSKSAQPLLKQSAGNFGENHRTGDAMCGGRTVARGRQKGVSLTGTSLRGADDLPEGKPDLLTLARRESDLQASRQVPD